MSVPISALYRAEATHRGNIVINPETDALLVIDAQPTFMPGGGLAVKDGQLVVPVIRRLLPLFPKRRRIASKDRHPRGHISLASSYVSTSLVPITPNQTVLTRELWQGWKIYSDVPRRIALHAKFNEAQLEDYLTKVGIQILWSDHAIAGQDEAELHPDLPESEFGYVLVKGTDPACHSYSAFFDDLHRPTELADVLRERGVRRVFVCGLAFDFCAGWTAKDAVEYGFETYVIEDATRPVDLPGEGDKLGTVDTTYKSFVELGIKVVQSDQILAA